MALLSFKEIADIMLCQVFVMKRSQTKITKRFALDDLMPSHLADTTQV
jgi:hypothetical protein